jgi:hypothetical protein
MNRPLPRPATPSSSRSIGRVGPPRATTGALQLVEGAERVDEPVVVAAVEVLTGQPQVADVGWSLPEAGQVVWHPRVSGDVGDGGAELRVASMTSD